MNREHELWNFNLIYDILMNDGEDKDKDSLFDSGCVVWCWWWPAIVGVTFRLIVGERVDIGSDWWQVWDGVDMEVESGTGAGHTQISDEVTSESGWKAGSAHTSDCIPASLGIFLPVALSQASSTMGTGFRLQVVSNGLVRLSLACTDSPWCCSQCFLAAIARSLSVIPLVLLFFDRCREGPGVSFLPPREVFEYFIKKSYVISTLSLFYFSNAFNDFSLNSPLFYGFPLSSYRRNNGAYRQYFIRK